MNAVGDGAGVSPRELQAGAELVLRRLHTWTLKVRLQGSQPFGNVLMSQDVSGRFARDPGHRMPSPMGRKSAPAMSSAGRPRSSVQNSLAGTLPRHLARPRGSIRHRDSSYYPSEDWSTLSAARETPDESTASCPLGTRRRTASRPQTKDPASEADTNAPGG